MTRAPKEVLAHHGKALAAGDRLFLGWAADSAVNRVDDGVDTKE
jgi:hypothetical protein